MTNVPLIPETPPNVRLTLEIDGTRYGYVEYLPDLTYMDSLIEFQSNRMAELVRNTYLNHFKTKESHD